MNPINLQGQNIQYPTVNQPNIYPVNTLSTSPMGDNNLLNALSNYQSAYQPTPATDTTTTNQEPGNWFTNNLATGLSVLGGLAGGYFGGVPGAIAGSGLGGGLGKSFENVLEEGTIKPKEVAKEAALSGALSLAGEGVGRVAGKVGAKAFGTAFPTVAKEATEAGGGLTGTAKAIGKRIVGKTTQTAEEAAAKPSTAAKYGARFLQGAFNNNIDENAARDLYIRYGLKNPNEAVAVRNLVTGSAESEPGQALINKIVEGTVQQAGKSFDPTDLASGITRQGMPLRGGTIAEKIISEAPAGAISDKAEKNLYQEFSKTVKDLLGAQVGNQQASAYDALRTARVYAEKASKAKMLGTPEGREVANIYNKFANELFDRALAPGGQDIVLGQAEKQALSDAIISGVQGINPKAAAGLADDIANANTLKDFRNIQSKWVQAGNAAEDAAAQQAGRAGITSSGLGEAFSTPIRSTGRAAGKVLGSTLDRNMPGILQGASTGAQLLGLTSPKLQGTLAGAGANLLGNVAYNYQPQAQGGATMSPEGTGMGAGMAGAGGGMGAGQPGQGMGGQPSALSDLQRAYMRVALFNPTLMGAMVQSPEQRASSQTAVEALNAVNTLEDTLLKAGGGQGRIGGTIAKIQSVGGGPSRTYAQQKRNAAMKIAQAMGTTDIGAIEQNMPDLTDTAEEAAGKIQAFKQQLRTTLQASQQTGLSGLGFSGTGGTPSLLSGLMR